MSIKTKAVAVTASAKRTLISMVRFSHYQQNDEKESTDEMRYDAVKNSTYGQTVR
jgi:hypothetical protein